MGGSNITRERGDQLVAARKSFAPGSSLLWSDVRAPDGTLVRRHLAVVAVVAEGCEEALELLGIYRGDDDTQVILRAVEEGSEAVVARLCWNPHHAGDLHWHWWRRQASESVTHPPATITPEVMLIDVFLPHLNFTGQTGMPL